jgi:hypothetical protein
VTTYSHREIVHRRVEYGAEAGCDAGTFNKVWHIAYADWCQRTGYEASSGEPEAWATVHPRDEETVIAFTTDEPAGLADGQLAKAREAVTELVFLAMRGKGSGRDGRISEDDIVRLFGTAMTGGAK